VGSTTQRGTLTIGMGGGGGFAWALDEDLLHGVSSDCATFASPPLASARDFSCVDVEVWALVEPELVSPSSKRVPSAEALQPPSADARHLPPSDARSEGPLHSPTIGTGAAAGAGSADTHVAATAVVPAPPSQRAASAGRSRW
jgi:hypothetical protein